MKFLLDDDLPDDLSYLIEQLGHDVLLLRKAILPSPPTLLFFNSPTTTVVFC